MNMSELMKLFREGQNEGRKRGYVMQGSCDAEGVRFVVRALRDEFSRAYNTGYNDADEEQCPTGPLVADRTINRILGDAGNEKVAGGSTREDECGLQGQVTPSPATDPAPAVCVWIDQVKGMAWAGCNNKLYPIKSAVNGCNGCGKPIKFTEAK